MWTNLLPQKPNPTGMGFGAFVLALLTLSLFVPAHGAERCVRESNAVDAAEDDPRRLGRALDDLIFCLEIEEAVARRGARDATEEAADSLDELGLSSDEFRALIDGFDGDADAAGARAVADAQNAAKGKVREAREKSADADDIAKEKEKAEGKKKENEKLTSFLDNFGIGFAQGFGLGNDRVESASLDANNIVRVDEDITDSTRIVLEAHHFFSTKIGEHNRIAHGPFATVNFGVNDANTLTSFGVGWMIGFQSVLPKTKSFNVGVAYALDRGVKRLRGDFREGVAAPLDATGMPISPAFKTSTQPTVLLVLSITP